MSDRRGYANWDRRERRRFAVPTDEHVEVALTSHGTTYSCALVDISEAGLQVELGGQRPPLRTDEEVEVSLLGLGPALGRVIGGLRVKRFAEGSRGLRCVLLTDRSDAKATLWYIVDSLFQGHVPRWQSSMCPQGDAPKIPARGLYTEPARLERLDWLRKQTGALLTAMEATRLSAERLRSNIENMVGAVEVPVGIAGPLLFRGKDARGIVYAPFATTEGALVASATRGATALTQSGGVTTRVLSQRMMRVPLFVLSSLRAAIVFASWVRDHEADLKREAESVSRYAKLISVSPNIIGNHVHVTFLYETGDAAGQNMTTACTWRACQWLLESVKPLPGMRVEDFIIEANVSGDKKVTFASFIQGRGLRVVAEARLDADVMQETLKVTPEELARTVRSCQSGGIHGGMIGFNANVANVVAALFTATGQDIACVHESSLAQLNVEADADGVYASLVMPALIVGTVGGGTHLPGQRALLEMMGCAGAGKVARLAEIICGFALALDLSTLSAIASGQFAGAHERLGRNRPVEWFQQSDLNASFFESTIRERAGSLDVRVETVTPIARENGSSIVTELTSNAVSKLVGLFPYRLGVTQRGDPDTLDVMVKVKPLDEEVVMMVHRLATMCSPRVAAAHARVRHRTGFLGCHERELAIMGQTDARFVLHAPRVLGIYREPRREAYVLVEELLEDCKLLDTTETGERWTADDLRVALTGAAELHSLWYGRDAELLTMRWLGEVPSEALAAATQDLWDTLAAHVETEFPRLFSQDVRERYRSLIRGLPRTRQELDAMPRTLIHNDFNPRNICLRAGRSTRLCAYDWELATLDVPQRDVAELLAFTLSPQVDRDSVTALLEHARTELERTTGVAWPREDYVNGFTLSLRDFAVRRLLMYLMAHTFRQYTFLDRVIPTTMHLLNLFGGVA